MTVALISLLFLLALFLGLLYPLENINIKPENVEKALLQSGLEDDGTFQVYFCPMDNCELRLQQLLAQAQTSIHCALYDLNLNSLQEIFLEKATKMEVQIVMDDDYIQKFRTPFTKADKQGAMHNKFCVIDQQWLFTGSTNPTENDARKNNNNLIITTLPTLIQNYEEEFQELWNGTFKTGKAVKKPIVFRQNMTIQNYFCPEDSCAEHVVKELAKAQFSIYFMTFSFTHEAIANILLLKKLDNLTVEGVIETRQVTKDSPFKRFNQNGISTLKDGNPRTMHHKVFIIDQKTVITGSMNPTNNGNKNNDENLLIIDDKKIAAQFLEEYNRVRTDAEKHELEKE